MAVPELAADLLLYPPPILRIKYASTSAITAILNVTHSKEEKFKPKITIQATGWSSGMHPCAKSKSSYAFFSWRQG